MPDFLYAKKPAASLQPVNQALSMDGKPRPRLVMANASSPNHFANFFASSSAYSFVISPSIAISYTPEYQVENLSPVHM